MKICSRCHIKKNESDFYFNKSMGYFTSWCKKCLNAYAKSKVINKKRERKKLYKKYGIKQI